MVTVYGVVVLTFMMAMYALERRDRRFVAAFCAGMRGVEQLWNPQWSLAVRRYEGAVVRRRPEALCGVGDAEIVGGTPSASSPGRNRSGRHHRRVANMNHLP
jgi:hypothetical protein